MTKKIDLIFLLALFLYSSYCVTQLGMTWDVGFHYTLGKDRLDYLFSLGSNEVNKTPYVNKFYTGTYSTISALFVQFFPRKYIIEAIYIFNLLFSIFAILGIYKISKELFNKQIGQIAFVICFFNPIFFGHMAMNSTDTVIAFANIWCTYLVIRYLKFQKIIKRKNNYVILLGLSLGLGLGVRHSFLITLLPVFIFLILEIFYLKIFIDKKFLKKVFIFDFIKVLLISYIFMILFWPQTHENIFFIPLKLVIESLSFGFGAPYILFNGEIFLTHEIPKNYILINLFYKMPEFTIVSFIIFIFLFKKIGSHFIKKFKGFYFKIFLIFLIILFPNILLWVNPYGVYDGFRLFIYIIPFISLITAVLISFLIEKINLNLIKVIFSILIILKIFFIYNFFLLTPYHYVYLNIFAGKYSENYKKFENDYWGISTKKLISQISNSELLNNKKIKIATCGLEENAQENYLKKIKNLKFDLVNKDEEFDYIIMNNRVIWNSKSRQTCFQKFNGKDIFKIKRRGLVLSKITKI